MLAIDGWWSSPGVAGVHRSLVLSSMARADFCLARNWNLTRHCNDTHTTLPTTSHRSWSAFQHRIQDDVPAPADAAEPVRPAAAAALG